MTASGNAPSESRILESHRLGNGLPILLRPERSLPIVTLDFWVRVGAADEPEPIAGASHFLEHMLFKGTERLAVGEYDRRIEAAGAYLNAATSYDYTHYYVELPSDRLEGVLEDFADVLCNSAVSAEETERERQVILEEIRRKNDNPVGFLYDSIVAAGMLRGPYAHTVLGPAESVAAMSAETLRDHYRRHYTADNSVLVVTGAVERAALEPLLERHFAALPVTRMPHRENPPAVAFAPAGETLWPRDWRECYFYHTWPGPPVRTVEDAVRNDLAEALLASGRTSRLVQSVRDRKKLVSAIGAHFPSHRHPGLHLIGGRCETKNLRAASDAIFEELDLLFREGLRDGEEARLRRQLRNGFVYHALTNSNVASTIGYSWSILGNGSMYTEYERVAAEYPMEDVLRFLRSLLPRDRSSLFATAPQAELAALGERS